MHDQMYAKNASCAQLLFFLAAENFFSEPQSQYALEILVGHAF